MTTPDSDPGPDSNGTSDSNGVQESERTSDAIDEANNAQDLGGSSDRKWSDLAPRILSAAAMVAVAATLIWLGGLWFHSGLALIIAGMVWELSRMQEPGRGFLALKLGGIAGLALFAAAYVPLWAALPVLALPSIAVLSMVAGKRPVFVVFTAMIMIAGFGMIWLRDDFGIPWLMWLISVVIVTDVAGYFAGRMFGGPKFWPRISPKKTWSGTAAGWVGAAIVGAIFGVALGVGVTLAIASVAVSLASQMGDIAESAIKRRAGVKDSSALIPGHGGLLDRFDGMLGGALLVMLAAPFFGLPPGLG